MEFKDGSIKSESMRTRSRAANKEKCPFDLTRPPQHHKFKSMHMLYLLIITLFLLFFSVRIVPEGFVTSTNTFRDGFIVVNRDNTKDQIASAHETTEVKQQESTRTGNLKSTTLKDDPSVETHTTTIKTQEGDEITIKHGTDGITRISRDENGKITIENEKLKKEREENKTKEQPTVNANVSLPDEKSLAAQN
ncbi:hypothetical protein ABG067_006160 [Albugo candida]